MEVIALTITCLVEAVVIALLAATVPFLWFLYVQETRKLRNVSSFCARQIKNIDDLSKKVDGLDTVLSEMLRVAGVPESTASVNGQQKAPAPSRWQ